MTMFMTVSSSIVLLLLLLPVFLHEQQIPFIVHCEPLSRPYVAYLTSPWDQSIPITTSKKIKRNANSTSYIESEIQWMKIDKTQQIYNPITYIHVQEENTVNNQKCPIDFSLGFSSSSSSPSSYNHSTTNYKQNIGIHSSPILYPIHPADTPGKSILFLRDYDYLDMITPTRDSIPYSSSSSSSSSSSTITTRTNSRETTTLTRDDQFPLLFEQSMFGYNMYPLIQDVDSDGIPDAILVDYDGAILIVGLDTNQNQEQQQQQQQLLSLDEQDEDKTSRLYHQRQIPRLIVRKDWVQDTLHITHGKEKTNNPTYNIQQMTLYGLDPYHSFFEYNSDDETTTKTITQPNVPFLDTPLFSSSSSSSKQEKIHIFRGIGGNLLDLSVDIIQIQKQEQERMVQQRLQEEKEEYDWRKHKLEKEKEKENISIDSKKDSMEQNILQQEQEVTSLGINQREGINYYGDDMMAGYNVHQHNIHGGDDYYPIIQNRNKGMQETVEASMRNQFYKDENYIHLPPHVLTTPTYTEIPSRYKKEKNDPFLVEELLLIPVSYYMDEEEFIGHQRYKRFKNVAGGDENDMLRGQYVASALIVYDLVNQRFVSNIHLDLSTDDTTTPLSEIRQMNHNNNNDNNDDKPYTKKPWDDRRIGAFALASPTVADLDGDGVMEAIIGTSMGMVYSLSLPYGYRNLGFPVQMKYPVEQPILVEDVLGDRDLEVFIIDSGGNIVCLDYKGGTYWHRTLLGVEEESMGTNITKTSSMMMGDVNGDGSIDIVVTVLISRIARPYRSLRIYAIDAIDGKDISFFPQDVSMEGSESYLDDYIATVPDPLLVDLHARSKGSSYKHVISQATRTRKGRFNHGGISPGLHIVQPLQSVLYIIEGGSGCYQAKKLDFDVHAMVQIDDMDGSQSLDLVLTSTTGHVFTVVLPDVVPYHPLNLHPRPGLYVHGSSASAGVFIHSTDRNYRDVLGVVFYLTLEVFDRKFSYVQESNKYYVEIRDGPSARRKIFQKIYDRPDIYTEKIYIPYGPGYYTLNVRMKTSHGLIYEDIIHIGYNVNYSMGLTSMLIFPIITAIISIVFLSRVKRIDTGDRPNLLP